jgi:hypothetical protein
VQNHSYPTRSEAPAPWNTDFQFFFCAITGPKLGESHGARQVAGPGFFLKEGELAPRHPTS